MKVARVWLKPGNLCDCQPSPEGDGNFGDGDRIAVRFSERFTTTN